MITNKNFSHSNRQGIFNVPIETNEKYRGKLGGIGLIGTNKKAQEVMEANFDAILLAIIFIILIAGLYYLAKIVGIW